MSVYLDNDMKQTMTRESTYLFDLVCVMVHDGEGYVKSKIHKKYTIILINLFFSGGSGHYTSYCVDGNEGNFKYYFDELDNIVCFFF